MANFSIAQTSTTELAALNAASKKKNNTSLDIDSFLQLIAAQIQNQDILGSSSGSSSNEDYVGQMLQMTLIQSISDMMEMSMTTYATSMLGKEVTVAKVDGTKVTEVTGTVTGVNLYGDDPTIQVDGETYLLSQIMTVGTSGKTETETPSESDPDTDKKSETTE